MTLDRRSFLNAVATAPLAARAAASATPAPFPRIANFYGAKLRPGATQEELDFLAKYSLIVGGLDLRAKPELARLKAANPELLVLHYISVRGQSLRNPLMKDGFWLDDPAGRHVAPWPNRALPNQTLPEVNDVMVRMAADALERLPQLDGIFLDSYYRQIAPLNGGKLDANHDGKADDPEWLNAAWEAGLLRVARGVRALRPGLIVMANGGRPIDFAFDELNGILFEDQLTYLAWTAAGKLKRFRFTADDLLAAYQRWEAVKHKPHVTAFVDGGGDVNNPWEWNKLDAAGKERQIEKARQNVQRMRFNLCFVLMGDGYAAFDYHTTARGQHWWFPEWDMRLRQPRGPTEKREAYWRREFEGATVYVNPYPQPASIKENKGFVLPSFDGRIVPL
jgi:Hypothetical glycosyl hydrolase family 15